jgi:cobalt/nickel transport system permease protein/cobalt/nickel transport protein
MKKFLILVSIFVIFSFAQAKENAQAKEKWTGVDEAIIEKYATQQGRPPRSSLLNIEGDALLFTFILAGAIGGFILGYNWHRLFKTRIITNKNRMTTN